MRAFTIVVLSAAVAVAAVAVRARLAGHDGTASADPSLVDHAAVDALRDRDVIATVRIDGANLPLATLEDVITTHAGAVHREADLARDRAAIVRTLVDRGYLAARVTDVRTTWRSDGAHVAFVVDAGGVYHVGALTVDGALAARFPALAAVPTILVGQEWRAARAFANQAILRDWLARHGARADVSLATRVDDAQKTVALTFTATGAVR